MEFKNIFEVGIPLEYTWKNKPQKFGTNSGVLHIEPGKKTDFYIPEIGKTTLNAPFLYKEVSGDFRFAAEVSFEPKNFADSAAIMVWAEDDIWFKGCLEYDEYGRQGFVSVATNGNSDDANHEPVPGKNQGFLRISRIGQTFVFHTSFDGDSWVFRRVLVLPMPEKIRVGFVAQSPSGSGGTMKYLNCACDSYPDKDTRSGK